MHHTYLSYCGLPLVNFCLHREPPACVLCVGCTHVSKVESPQLLGGWRAREWGCITLGGQSKPVMGVDFKPFEAILRLSDQNDLMAVSQWFDALVFQKLIYHGWHHSLGIILSIWCIICARK